MQTMKTILLVEDDEPIRDSLKDILEQEGYAVLAAANGQDGLEVLKKNPQICLVLLDLFMPVMSGLEFLKALRTENPPVAIASMPIVVLSASPPESEVVRAVKPVIQGFVKKPVDLEGFLSTVEKLCSHV